MDRVVGCFAELDRRGRSSEAERINCHHNFTEQETHFGKDGLGVPQGRDHGRRGRARADPGLDGHARRTSWSGKGNPLSLNSSPHGAGRELLAVDGRATTFTHERAARGDGGIEYRDTDAFIDEIPAAYKDIDQVMADAADLVEVRHTLRQIVNVKGAAGSATGRPALVVGADQPLSAHRR